MAAVYLVVTLLLELFRVITGLGLTAGCTIEVKDLPQPQPLFLLSNALGFLLPQGKDGIVNFNLGDEMLLACPGQSNYVYVLGSDVQLTAARCCSGGNFCIRNQTYAMAHLNCSKNPYPTARRSGGVCHDGTKKHLEIGFELLGSNNFLGLIDICFDEVALTTLYTKYDLVTINSFKMFNQKYIADKEFFKNLTLNELYKQQNETIGRILGSEELGNKYISASKRLTRGHLAARADFIYAPQQRATYHYINLAPQWNSFNNGSWRELEIKVREFAKEESLDLVVYTGTHGIAALPDASGAPQELYLYVDKNNNRAVPVPAIFWKVVYDPVNKTGIAFVGINNPFIAFATHLCEDVCDKTFWSSWRRQYIDKGYGYCCEVNDFRANVDVLPPFPVIGLLGRGGSRRNTLELKYLCFLFLLATSLTN